MSSMGWTFYYVTCLFILLGVLVLVANSEFVVGKVPPSNYDLAQLNGVYEPLEAAKLCDEHKICAGFTYRGLMNTTDHKKYEMYFFRYIHQIGTEAQLSNWVTYKTKKLFAEYYGIFAGKTKTLMQETNDFDLMCKEPGYAAVTVYEHNGMFREQYKMIDLSLDEFVPSDDIRTLFNFGVADDYVKDVTKHIDLCCPAHDKTFDVSNFITTVNDTLPRISCNISAEEFEKNYIEKRQPVILTGCIDDWYATQKWTLQNLLTRYDDEMLWKVDVSLDKDSPVNEKAMFKLEEQPDVEEMEGPKDVRSYGNLNLPGKTILDLMRMNATIRVFERVGTPPRRSRFLLQGNNTHKPDLFSEWSWPKAIPEDIYKPTFGGSDYQWIIMSTPQTGTHIHHDPEITDAWNALLYGHKYWTILPGGVYAGSYECDMRCSPDLDELYAVSWYNHVLPQLRDETWYGRKIIEVIQKPGEVIFVPNGMGHSVLNLDENLSITENFLSVGAIDELAQYYAYDWNPLSYESEGVAKRVWRNLMKTDLSDGHLRKYANEMLKQVKTIAKENIPTLDFEGPTSIDY